jgi:hypothetical protein
MADSDVGSIFFQGRIEENDKGNKAIIEQHWEC